MLMSVSFLSLMGKSFQILGPIEANELLWPIEVHDLVIREKTASWGSKWVIMCSDN